MSCQEKRGMPYLAQGALKLPQEVIVTQVNSFVIDVINPKLQLLHYFKVVVDDKLFCKLWAEAILDFLCACHLLGKVGLFQFFASCTHFKRSTSLRRNIAQNLKVIESATYWHTCADESNMISALHNTDISRRGLMINTALTFSLSTVTMPPNIRRIYYFYYSYYPT